MFVKYPTTMIHLTILVLFCASRSLAASDDGEGATANANPGEEVNSSIVETADSSEDEMPASAGEPPLPEEGGSGVPLLIEYETGLREMGERLSEVVAMRLARFQVVTDARELAEDGQPGADEAFDWNVTLRTVSEKSLILTVDSTEEFGAREVRTVVHDRDPGEMAWTLGLVVEEIITPYLDESQEIPALGAGLAIIEPEVIGGARKKEVVDAPGYPRFKGIGLALSLSGIWSIDEILVGPHVVLKGMFTRKALASFGLGWSGSANFSKENVSGSMSQIPIELLFGYMFLEQKHFDIVGWTGFSLGFAVYKTHDSDSSRTDMTFQPGVNLLVELVVKIVSPWAVVIEGGVNFPFVRDALVNNGSEIYTHVWVVPTISLGTQLYF